MPCRLFVFAGALALTLSSATELQAFQQDSSDARVRIIVDSLDRASFANLAELLQARVPGLHISRTGEGGMRWFMRGPSSVSESTPMILVDGIRVNAASSTLPLTGTRPPVLDDINLEDVERVEVLSGPATASRYGTGAANGIIRIVTFAPRSDTSRFRFSAATGVTDDNATYPANFYRGGVTPSGSPYPFCMLYIQGRGGCVPTGPPTSFNVLESDSPFEPGFAARVAGTVVGGSERLSWRGGGTYDREGVPSGAVSQRLHVRGAGSVRASEALDVTLRAHWTRGGADLPSLTEPSLLLQGLFARADTAWTGFTPPHSPDYASDRSGVVVTGAWRPRSWLDVRLTSGLERLVDEDDLEYVDSDAPVGPVLINTRGERRRRDLTARLDVESRYSWSWLRHATAATVERATSRQEDESREFEERRGSVFLRTFALNARTAITGLGLTHTMTLGSRLVVAGGVRLDQLKLNDVRWDVPVSPHASLSWVIRPFTPAALGGIRLRGALGHAAARLQPTLAFLPALPGGDDPKAEITRERELGLDAVAVHDRIAISATWYSKRTSDIPDFQAGPFFGLLRLEVLNRGLEASLRARILRTPRLTWDAHAWYAHNHNEVTRSDFLAPYPVNLGGLLISHRQWVAVGQPLGANRTSTISIRDLDGDGLLESVCNEGGAVCEVTVSAATDFRPAFPPTSVSLGTSVRYRAFTFSALVDHRSGHTLHNLSLEQRCVSLCQPLFDPATSQYQQAQALLAGASELFVEDASYTKLRELSIRFSTPASWARAVGAGRLDLTLAGRNLATWTDYGGPDPESTGVPWVALAHVDNAAMPLPRRLLLRADWQGR